MEPYIIHKTHLLNFANFSSHTASRLADSWPADNTAVLQYLCIAHKYVLKVKGKPLNNKRKSIHYLSLTHVVQITVIFKIFNYPLNTRESSRIGEVLRNWL